MNRQGSGHYFKQRALKTGSRYPVSLLTTNAQLPFTSVLRMVASFRDAAGLRRAALIAVQAALRPRKKCTSKEITAIINRR